MTTIHIEPSSRCTIACPQCPRTEYIDRMHTQDCDIAAMVAACRGFDDVLMCGNHGDPIYHRDFHGLIKALKHEHADRSIRIITNGAFRGQQWWETTADLLRHDRDSISFSIDGLPYNNHLYRVNSDWPSIELGIKTLRRVNPTLRLVWKWIAFQYNQDDAAAAITLARELGMNRFTLVSSVRYEPDHWLTPTQSFSEIKRKAVEWYQSHPVAS